MTTITRTTVLDDEQLLHLIAKAIAWNDGEELVTINETAASTLYRDSAQQCAEDLGLL